MTKADKKETVVYQIRRQDNGALVATGRKEDCARTMELTAGQFRNLVRQTRLGQTPYRIRCETVLERTDWRAEAAKEWDRHFDWLFRYPCNGCVHRQLCIYTDEYCHAFAIWFQRAYDRTAEKLRKTLILCQPQMPDAPVDNLAP